MSFDIKLLNNDIFIDACEKNDINYIKEIFPKKKWIFTDMIKTLYIKGMEKREINALCFCCKNGYFEVVKYICETNTFNISEKNELAFKLSCLNGNLEIVKYLLSLYSDIDIFIDNFEPFTLSCISGNLEMVQYLINKFPEILEFSNMNDIFISVCEYGNIEIAKFLINIKPDINFLTNNHDIIKLVSINGHLNILKWLFEIEPNIKIDKFFLEKNLNNICAQSDNCEIIRFLSNHINLNNEEDFTTLKKGLFGASINKNVKIIDLLSSLYSDFFMSNIEEFFIEASRCDNLEICKFLIKKLELSNREVDIKKILFTENIYSIGVEVTKFFINLEIISEKDINFEKYLIIYSSFEEVEYILSLDIELENSVIEEYLIEVFNKKGKIFKLVKLLYEKLDNFDLTKDDFIFFHKACYSGDIELVKWVYSKCEKNIMCYLESFVEYEDMKIIGKLIEEMCDDRYFDIAKWLYDLSPDPNYFSPKNYYNHFSMFRFRGFEESKILEAYNWMYSINPFTSLQHLSNQIFGDVCISGSINIVKFIFEKFSNEIDDYNIDFGRIFRIVCGCGYLDILEYISNKKEIQDENFKRGFMEAYGKKKLHVLKWIYNKKPELIKSSRFEIIYRDREYCFDINSLKWILSEGIRPMDFCDNIFINYYFYQNQEEIFNLINKYKINLELPIYRRGIEKAITEKNNKLIKKFFELEPEVMDEMTINKLIDFKNLEILKIIINKDNIDEIAKNKIFTRYCRKSAGDEIINYFFSLQPKELCFHTFENFCKFKDLDYIKNLYDSYSNIRNSKNSKFYKLIVESFFDERLEITNWLINLKPDIKINANHALMGATKKGKIKSVLDIISRYDVTDLETLSSCFENFLLYGFLDHAKKIFDLKPEIVEIVDTQYIFIQSCYDNYFDIAKYIFNLDPNIDIRSNDDEGFRYIANGTNVDFINWFVELLPDVYIVEFDTYSSGVEYLVHWAIKITIDKQININDITKEKDICMICHEESNVMTSCNHFYCENCILNWLSKNSKCPYCREELDKDDLFKIVM